VFIGVDQNTDPDGVLGEGEERAAVESAVRERLPVS